MDARAASVLTEKDYEELNRALTDLALTERQIADALKADFDCAPEDQLCRSLKERLAKIKAVYFPGKP